MLLPPLKPFWSGLSGQVKLYHGDALAVVKRLPSESVHTIITSPPYWGQRDYGVEGQIGSEESPEVYIEQLVTVFKELYRVLRDDGTLWLNLGDKYLDGELLGLPWRVAIELQRLYTLRQDIIWHKPSPMPAPATNRCVTAHEYLFLFSKNSSDYYFDFVAIQEPTKSVSLERAKWAVGVGTKHVNGSPGQTAHSIHQPKPSQDLNISSLSNKRDVWTVPFEGLSGAHFAPFPQKLVEPALLAGCPERVCSRCGSPHNRRVEKEQIKRDRSNDFVKRNGAAGTGNACANSVAGVTTRTLGWKSSCDCATGIVGGLVLDPFVGSGTTLCVALANGRRGLGIDLSANYLGNIAVPRIEGTALEIPDLAVQVAASRTDRRLSSGMSLIGGTASVSK